MTAFGQSWRTRDELSFRNIRSSTWGTLLIFPAVVIMGDLRFVDIGQELFGVGSFTLELTFYSFAMLVSAFIPRARFLSIVRAAIIVEIAAFVLALIVPASLLLPIYLINAFAYGLCCGYGLLLFFFSLNNAERLFSLMVIVFYYIVCVEWLWQYEAARYFMIQFLPFMPAAYLCFAFFVLMKDGSRRRHGIQDEPPGGMTGNTDDSVQTYPGGKSVNQIGAKGMTVVFLIYVIYTIMERLYTYVVYEAGFVTNTILVLGGLTGVVICIVIQFVLNRSVWIPWSIFLICALLSTGLLSVGSPAAAGIGSLLYGAAQHLGYIAAFYLVGGTANLSGSMQFFRIYCLVEFVLMGFVSPILGTLFAGIGSHYNYIAFGVVIVVICIMLVLQPVLSKYVFGSAWVSELNTLDERKYPEAAAEAAEADRTEDLGLTAREKQVFTLLLTGMPKKQIATELKISNPTINFHANNLYRKLNIQSRVELFAKYHVPEHE
ncbi:MAG: helix-turn-helix transcriptional regulator [Clostridiales Family XIII bacterium]|jgi:DNA-binding CsgD family transcriptional regulator|nr:helix-turn-helix transcriptional regulator [Clostridiales Family XIII bacterium]